MTAGCLPVPPWCPGIGGAHGLSPAAGLETFLVLTGSTTREDVQNYPFRPSHIRNSIADLIELV